MLKLPDLGEGLTEAEIIQWYVNDGTEVAVDQLLLSVETAKALVDIPSPQAGRIQHRFGRPGDIVHIGDPLVEFAGDEEADLGSVVGRIVDQAPPSEEPMVSPASSTADRGYRVTPAVRALAQRLNVDLSIVTPTGTDGHISANDIQRVARLLAEAGPLEPLRSTRRAMARSMEKAHSEVVSVTVTDDADINAWYPDKGNITVRLIQAIVAACQAEPALNAWYDSKAMGRRLLTKIDLGVAVDTEDGLFVPVLRNVAQQSGDELRTELDRIKQAVRNRSVQLAELRGYTFILSSFGGFGGRYANPIIVPPTVAILGAGSVHSTVVMVDDKPQAHPFLPLSLSFDHRAVTGGEAARFLATVIHTLQAG